MDASYADAAAARVSQAHPGIHPDTRPHATPHCIARDICWLPSCIMDGGQAHATSPPGSRDVLPSAMPPCRRPHMPCHVGVDRSSWGCPRAACYPYGPGGVRPSSRSSCCLLVLATSQPRTLQINYGLDWIREHASQRDNCFRLRY